MAVKKLQLQNSGRELLTGDELCRKLKVKRSFLYAPARRKGPDALPSVRVGKYLRYDVGAVVEWIKKQNLKMERGK